MLSAALAGLALGLSLIIAIGAQNLFVLRQGIRREHALLVAAVCAASDVALIVLGVSGLGLVLQAVPWLIVAVRWAGAVFLVAYGLLAARRAWRPSGQALEVAEADAAVEADAAADADAEAEADGSAEARAAAIGTADPAVAPRPDTATVRRSATGRTPPDDSAVRHQAPGTTPPVTSTVRRSAASVVLTCLALTWLNPHVYLDTVFLLGGVAATHGDARWTFAAGAAVGSVVWFFALAIGARHLGRWLRTPRSWRILDAIIAVVMIGLGISLVLPVG